MAIAELIADSLIEHTVDLTRYDADVRQQILAILVRIENDIVGKLSIVDPTAAGAQTKYQRLRVLLSSVQESIEQGYKDIDVVNNQALYSVATAEVAASNSALAAIIGSDIMSITLTDTMLHTLADKSLVLGAPATEYWERQANKLVEQFTDAMRLGVAQNEGLNQLVQRVRGNFTGSYKIVKLASGRRKRVGKFANGIMPISTSNAEALVRTSVQSIANNTRMEVMNRQGGMIKGHQALVTLDSRTTLLCMGRSGMAWNLDGSPMEGTRAKGRFPGPPPWHYNCRSTLIPVLKSWAELAGPNSTLSNAKLNALDKLLNASTQSSMDGQVAGDIVFEDWLRTKSKAFQLDKLGPTRLRLWEAGKLSFPDLIDMSGNPLTVEQLLKKYDK